MKRLITGLCLILLTAFGSCKSSLTNSTTEILISAPEADSAEPAVAADTEGNLYVLYVEHGGDKTADVYLQKFGSDAKATGERIRINPEAGSATAWGEGYEWPAVRKLLAQTGMKIDQIDLFELNEAFAAQALYCARELGIDQEKLNVNGGAIALGHPLGVSGTRLVITALNGVAEELFFRGALYAATTRYPVIVTTVAYGAATLATGNVMLAFAALLLGALVGLERRATGGILAPIITHVAWSVSMLFLLPALFG